MQLYVEGIIFGSTNKTFNEKFAKLMIDRFEMSMMGKIMFFSCIRDQETRSRELHQPSQVHSIHTQALQDDWC
jgi:hypothetical protein